MTRTSFAAAVSGTALLFLVSSGAWTAPVASAASDPAQSGRFVWRDLMTRDVAAAKRFYGDLFGWRFEDTTRGGRPYVVARAGDQPVAGLVDVSAMPNAGVQWLSFMSVADLDKAAASVRADGGRILVEPRTLAMARVAVVADPQGAPLGLAELRQAVPDAPQPIAARFFWQEYLARDTNQALAFYRRLAGYESTVTESRLGVEYHVLRQQRARAGLFQLPETATDIQPNWLPYVLIDDPAKLAERAVALGGRVLVAASPERRNGSLVVVADPGGAALALQKLPF